MTSSCVMAAIIRSAPKYRKIKPLFTQSYPPRPPTPATVFSAGARAWGSARRPTLPAGHGQDGGWGRAALRRGWGC